ncbi:hypothetical protein, partial [uncultured Muribaculum sp.]|uniref:hypothetical protein n=1 Tax=uncultured Muribaculum sp. TaxID=1918613 RepID=UPI0025B73504
MFCGYSQNVYLCGVVKMLPPRQRYKKGARLANFKTIEYANDRRNKRTQVQLASAKLAICLKNSVFGFEKPS